ncbi:MAG: hypothetical protein ACYTFW_03680 [Planctomycetota bacterium]|jgi:hypothetical protein
MGISSRPVFVGPQQPVVINSIFIPVGGNFPLNPASPVDVSSATVISPGEFGVTDEADKVLIQTVTQNIRFTLDGTPPTATSGFQLKTTDMPLLISILPGVTLTVIQEAATASVNFQFGV